MSALIRALTYVTVLVGLVLVFLPAQVLSETGISRPTELSAPQIGGIVGAAMGAALVVWCVLAFAFIGRGTPLPFDPPLRLVIRGPYRVVRNPMAIGAGSTLGAAALFYESLQLLGFTVIFVVVIHLFVVFYEEPVLKRTFGEEYAVYCDSVRRWLPGLPT
jgi:protein-S-isoprenylcysteine O-methyltransferase Ste14